MLYRPQQGKAQTSSIPWCSAHTLPPALWKQWCTVWVSALQSAPSPLSQSTTSGTRKLEALWDWDSLEPGDWWSLALPARMGILFSSSQSPHLSPYLVSQFWGGWGWGVGGEVLQDNRGRADRRAHTNIGTVPANCLLPPMGERGRSKQTHSQGLQSHTESAPPYPLQLVGEKVQVTTVPLAGDHTSSCRHSDHKTLQLGGTAEVYTSICSWNAPLWKHTLI